MLNRPGRVPKRLSAISGNDLTQAITRVRATYAANNELIDCESGSLQILDIFEWSGSYHPASTGGGGDHAVVYIEDGVIDVAAIDWLAHRGVPRETLLQHGIEEAVTSGVFTIEQFNIMLRVVTEFLSGGKP